MSVQHGRPAFPDPTGVHRCLCERAFASGRALSKHVNAEARHEAERVGKLVERARAEEAEAAERSLKEAVLFDLEDLV